MVILAGGYDRQSAERENSSTASPATQRAANRGKAEALAKEYARDGVEVKWLGHFSEAPGTSAFTGVDRPEFNRILDMCRNREMNMIIVHYISRLSREEPLDIIPVVTELLRLGVTIVSVNEGTFRPGEMMDLIHLIMRLQASHDESKNKSVAVSNAKELAKRLGGHTGSTPYGFDTVEEMVPNPEDGGKLVAIRRLVPSAHTWEGAHGSEGAVIRWAWQEIKTHRDTPFKGGGAGSFHPGSLNGLCERLYRDKVPTRGTLVGKKRAGSDWDPGVLKRVLSDPRIAGYQADIAYKVRADGSRGGFSHYKIRRDPVTMEPLTLPGFEPYIPPAEWWELQEWLQGRGRGKGQYRGQSLLSAMDVLYCYGSGQLDPETGYSNGSTMAGNVREGDQAHKSSYACKCPRRVHDGSSCSITMHNLDPYIVGAIFARITAFDPADPDDLEGDTAALMYEAARRWGATHERPELKGQRSELMAQRADAVKALEELYEDKRNGGYRSAMGRRAFLEEEAALTLRMEGAEERLRQLDAADSPVLPIGEWLGDRGSDPTGPGSWWALAPLEDRRAFVRLFVDRIEVIKLPKGVQRPGRVPPIADRVRIHWAKPKVEEETEPETLNGFTAAA
nr:TG1 integrase [Vector pEN-TG1]BAF03600.1 integrase [Tigunavirus TG1]